MKFVQRDMGAAAEASNPGPAGMRREIVFLLVATLGLVLALYFLVGTVVELTLPRISVARERAWFGDFTPAARTAEPASAMEISQLALARKTLARLTLAPGVPALDYRLVLLAETEPNAVAFPGGTIGVTRGLLDVADSEIALAFVLGHELGHFAQRDHLRGLGRSVGRAIAWAVIFGDTSDALSGHTSQLLDLAHSRQQEAGADHFGLSLVHHAYGKTEGSERLFAWLERNRQHAGWAAWLQSHPDVGDRLQRLREAAAKLDATAPLAK